MVTNLMSVKKEFKAKFTLIRKSDVKVFDNYLEDKDYSHTNKSNEESTVVTVKFDTLSQLDDVMDKFGEIKEKYDKALRDEDPQIDMLDDLPEDETQKTKRVGKNVTVIGEMKEG